MTAAVEDAIGAAVVPGNRLIHDALPLIMVPKIKAVRTTFATRRQVIVNVHGSLKRENSVITVMLITATSLSVRLMNPS